MPLTPSLKVLHHSQSTLSHQGRVPGQNVEMFADCGYYGRRVLEYSSFPPVHVAMVHQSLPSFESMYLCMQKGFFRSSAPQIDSLKAQEMSAMSVSFCICLTFFTTFSTL